MKPFDSDARSDPRIQPDLREALILCIGLILSFIVVISIARTPDLPTLLYNNCGHE